MDSGMFDYLSKSTPYILFFFYLLCGGYVVKKYKVCLIFQSKNRLDQFNSFIHKQKTLSLNITEKIAQHVNKTCNIQQN